MLEVANHSDGQIVDGSNLTTDCENIQKGLELEKRLQPFGPGFLGDIFLSFLRSIGMGEL
jgi:hypothetical protein